jgi:phosphomannomutase
MLKHNAALGGEQSGHILLPHIDDYRGWNPDCTAWCWK